MARLRNIVSVWKHDCVKDGRGPGEPCDPPCPDPWNVETGKQCLTFATWDQAMAFADKEARR